MVSYLDDIMYNVGYTYDNLINNVHDLSYYCKEIVIVVYYALIDWTMWSICGYFCGNYYNLLY